MPPAVGVGIGVLVVHDGRVLLGRRKNAHGANTFALPGGWLEPNETFEDCASRELKEETALDQQDLMPGSTPEILPTVANNMVDQTHSVTVFVRMRLAPHAKQPVLAEPEKCFEWRWHPLTEPLPQPLFPPLAHLIGTSYWAEHVIAAEALPPSPPSPPPKEDKDLVVVTPDAIEVGSTARLVLDPTAGGVALFCGTTRDTFEGKEVLRLEYEAHPTMARSEMLAICGRMRAKWSLRHIAMVHRTGVVACSESSVEIAVSSVHRREALEAARFAIDELKANVPIWKREVSAVVSGVWKENPESLCAASAATVEGRGLAAGN